ncbi:hypothetical protein [Filimonas effusa]|uniref:Uncharacterized protein n=1 Tax=Filimonas effusa TaxID=2508721 RepID=A0A4V1MAK0_9BACT|nr:hypothetical protein [Filimonas effusa]RXK86146.1 hypothetical protein ESB13_04870 [Filimonas effusa]
MSLKKALPILLIGWMVIALGINSVSGQPPHPPDKSEPAYLLLPGLPFALPAIHVSADTALTVYDTVPYYLPALVKERNLSKALMHLFLLPNIESIGYTATTPGGAAARKKSDLVIHGNVLYNMDYRSYSDTPYAEKDIYYHTVQTYLDITWKDQYPMRLYLTNRFGNSSFTRHFSDVNFNFNTTDFRNRIVQKINTYPPAFMMDSITLWKNKLDLKRIELTKLTARLNDPGLKQRLVEEKERLLYGGTLKYDTSWPPDARKLLDPIGKAGDFKLDTPVLSWQNRYVAWQKKADSLNNELAQMEKKYYDLQGKLKDWKRTAATKRKAAFSPGELEWEMEERQVPDSILPKGYKQLLAIRSMGVGRTLVNYSELSARNVSITGFQAEYNPSYYVAVAAGTVDYRFRDFIVNNKKSPRQYLYMLRTGWGQLGGNNIILTWYSGKKQLFNNSGAATAYPDYRLLGFTLEGNYRLNDNTYITAELAKSSLPYYNNTSKDLFATALSMKDHSNEAYSLKLQSRLPATQTVFTGFIKQYGANFQSFSLVTTGVKQKAWLVQAEQPFFKKKLLVKASLKENDYNNLQAVSYHANTVFKTIQATLRLPKWPVLLVGYYPSAQLTKLSDESYIENTFYSLVANASYYYSLGETAMNSVATYSRFYNRQADSGFLHFNTTNIMLNHAVFFSKRFTWQATGSAAVSADYNLYSLDNDIQYALTDWLSIGAGVKYNRQTNYNLVQWGYKNNILIKIKRIGELQMMLDNGFLPGPEKRLVENKTGRISFFRTF